MFGCYVRERERKRVPYCGSKSYETKTKKNFFVLSTSLCFDMMTEENSSLYCGKKSGKLDPAVRSSTKLMCCVLEMYPLYLNNMKTCWLCFLY